MNDRPLPPPSGGQWTPETPFGGPGAAPPTAWPTAPPAPTWPAPGRVPAAPPPPTPSRAPLAVVAVAVVLVVIVAAAAAVVLTWGDADGPAAVAEPAPPPPAWCPEVAGLDGPGPVGHTLARTTLEDDIGTADMCLYDGGLAAARWSGRTIDDLEEAIFGLGYDRFDANDGEHAGFYYDGDTMVGCAIHATVDTVYGACGPIDFDDPRMRDLHPAIKDAVG